MVRLKSGTMGIRFHVAALRRSPQFDERSGYLSETSPPISGETLARVLAKELGLVVAPEEVHLEHRYWRWVVRLPGDLIAFVAGSTDAASQLARERGVLDLLRERVTFATPSIIYCSGDNRLQVRRMVSGIQIAGEPEPAIVPRLARDLGRAFAELHGAIDADACRALGIGRGRALPSPVRLEARFAGKPMESHVADALAILLDRYRQLDVPPQDVVFTHGDPWGGNLAVDPDTGALNGLFDFDEMGFDDRNIDLRYLSSFGTGFEARALKSYEQASGKTPSARRIGLYHMISAFDALADALEAGEPDMIAIRRRWVDGCVRDLLGGL
jgi:aminoglycoside phosphotransferase (APT) family kinase protein